MSAFTLIEVLIVVGLMAILVAVVIPVVQTSTREAEQVAFVADLRIFTDAAMRYRFEAGQWPAPAAAGAIPIGCEAYFNDRRWSDLTPVGGAWDFEFETYGVKSAFGVDFVNGGGDDRDDIYMQQIDDIIDDGNLATGQFRKFAAGRYYFILALN